LSEPAKRRHLHTRTIIAEGYARDDGLWDIEGRLTDTKTYGFANRDRGRIEAGDPLHDMRVRLTVDLDLRIHRIEATTEASPYRICPDIAPNYRKLEGVVIGPGWRTRIRDVAGGREGCTHISELLGAMATAAYQTLYAERARRGAPPLAGEGKRPSWVDSCYALRAEGEVVRREWPHYAKDQAREPND
ncbi:MAG TPA: DUF2889 domain-containing protein, partial [Alphaproteobacteria bacterium]|nr:DUF2889 domain-containing protein [Alphaproteobacteria bacterium]